VPLVMPVRQGYRDQYRLLSYLGALIAAFLVGLSSSVFFLMPQYNEARVFGWCAFASVSWIFAGFMVGGPLWWVLVLRDGKLALGENGHLSYTWRKGTNSINLADVHTILWWKTKDRGHWRGPIRLWTKGSAMSIDPEAFTVSDRERLAAWLRVYVPPHIVQIGQDEFAHMLANMRREPTEWSVIFPFLTGRRFLVLLMSVTMLASLLGFCCWAYARFVYQVHDPIEISGRGHWPFGRIELSTAIDWILFTALPAPLMTCAFIGMIRGALWFDNYTNRDAYDSNNLGSEPPLARANAENDFSRG
jgi:hypothetical protein